MSPNTPLTFEEDVIDRLARIETALAGGGVRQDDQESRVRRLEKSQWFLSGIAAVLGTLLGHIGLHISTH